VGYNASIADIPVLSNVFVFTVR